MINLTELSTLRLNVTFKSIVNDCGILYDEDYDEIGTLETHRDGEAVVATWNAADVLIEIVRTELLVMAAERRVNSVCYPRSADEFDEYSKAADELKHAREANSKALSKVTM